MFAGVVVALVGGAVLGAAYLWSERHALVLTQMRSALAASGAQVFAIDLEEVGFSGVYIRSLRIGEAAHPDLLVEDMRAAFSFAGLLAGRVDAVSIGSLRLRAAFGYGGPVFGHLDPLVSTEPGRGGSAFPVDEVFIHDLNITASLAQGSIDLRGGVRLSLDGEGVHAQPMDGCFSFAWTSLHLGVGTVDDVSAEACLADPGKGLSWPMDLTQGLIIRDLPLVLRGDDRDVLLEANLGVVVIDRGDAEGHLLAARIMGSRLVLPGADLELRGVDFNIVLDVSGDEGALTGEWMLERALVEDTSPAARFAPFRLAGDGWVTPARATFDLVASERQSLTPLFLVAGAHEVVDGHGEAVVQVGPLAFRPEGLQPQNLLPFLKGLMTNVAGGVDGKGYFHWRPGHLTSAGTLNLEGLALTTEMARIEGVTGRLSFDQLLPPVSAPGQSLLIGLIDAGFPLTEGTVTFAVKQSGAVQIEKAQWPFAGGLISLSSGLIEPGNIAPELVLDVERVDLTALIVLLDLEGLSGSGTITGRIPIVVRDGDLIVAGARLIALEAGQLSYKGVGAGGLEGGQSALLFQALEDFRYTSLTLALDGNVQDRLVLKLRLEGANPELYDGYPFVINVNTEASFAELLRSATLSANALDMIRDRDGARQVGEIERLNDE